MSKWEDAQKAESESWLIPDEVLRLEKLERELIRYPRIREEIGLNLIDTSNKFILEIGGGPVGVIADIPARKKVVLEPLTPEFSEFYECPYHLKGIGENIPFVDGEVDVVVITNALDHCSDPEKVLSEVLRVLRPGGFLAIHNCINLASIHKHEGHRLNLDEDWFHNIIDSSFETVKESTFRKNGLRYGHILYKGKRGQPAFAGLYRKCIGYEKK